MGKKSPGPTWLYRQVAQAAKNANHPVTVSFTPGRMDAS
jgi:catalase (peroxidase I)